MKFFIIITLASMAVADKLENAYLPPGATGSSGASAGLQTPLGPSEQQQSPGAHPSFGASASSSDSASANAEILKYDNEQSPEGYRYAFETSNGIKAEQEGRVIPGANPEEGSLQVQGSFSYIGDDGQTYAISYTADENGYHAEGAHLPTPPPIPEAILKSLQLTDTSRSEGSYNSHKSSYDADAGY